jgi:hypothetical protein
VSARAGRLDEEAAMTRSKGRRWTAAAAMAAATGAMAALAAAAVTVAMAGAARAAAQPAAGAPASGRARAIDRRELCVTMGEVEQLGGHRLGIGEPEVRAVALADSTAAAEMRFSYLGASAKTKALGSGEVRRQLGLKLRAQDSCNLLYVMWRIEPRDEIVVSVKSNPGQRTHAECGTHGYANIKARRRAPAPPVAPGSQHALRAALQGRELRVWADGAPVWEGTLPADVESFDGPLGLRSDNVRVELDYRIGGGPPGPVSRVSAWLRQRCSGESREDAE